MIRNGVGPLGMLTEPYDRSGPPLSEEPDRNYYSTGPAVKPVCTGEPTGAVCTPHLHRGRTLTCDGTSALPTVLQKGSTAVQLGFLCDVSPSARGHVSPQAQGSGYTTRAISQNWTGVRQYGQIFMLAVQRSHAS